MRRSVLIVAAAIFLVTHATNLQVPLYSTYAEIAGFGSGISAIAFSAYVAGLLPTLTLLGGISDRAGRKKVILASLLCLAFATGLMVVHPTIHTLFATRILQGIGVGLITGTGAAYLSSLMPKNAAQVAGYISLTTALGFSSGALFTNISLWFNRSLVPFSYPTVLILLIACTVFVIRLPEQPVSLEKLIRLPAFPPGTISAGLAIALAWSLAGIVSVILPTQLMQYGLPNWSGPMLFIFVMSGVLLQPLARRLNSQRSLQLGCMLLILGYIIFTFGAWLGVVSLVLLGVAVAGTACYGFIYLGGMAEVVRLSGSHSARAVSGYFVCAYLGFGLPVIFIGFFSDQFGVVNALLGFGVIFLAANLVLGIYQSFKLEQAKTASASGTSQKEP
ncbi:MFS transporter [Nostocales cyanobacterium HT-58-2]|nr:MFS transporter [Nostocales cyanobacterium HT-58-2]